MVEEKIKKLKEGQKASLVDTVGTILLAVLKAFVGLISGSIALTADAVHDFSDSLSTIASWVGLKISERKPTEKFPYGYYKAENLTTLFICFFFLYAGFEILLDSVNKFYSIPKISYPTIALIVPVISGVYAYFISKYIMRIGKKIFSQGLIAIAQEAKVHIGIAASVFIGIFCSYLHLPYIEPLVGIGLSLLIFKIALTNGRDALYALMDVTPGEEIEKRIIKVLKSISNIKKFYDLKIRKSGPFIFGEVKVKVKGTIDIKRVHEISDTIEVKLKEEVPNLDSFTIHVEPWEENRVKLVLPIDQAKGLKSKISEVTSRAKYFIFVSVDKKKKKIISFYTKENPLRKRKVRTGLALSRMMLKEKVNGIVVKAIGDIAFHSLRDNFITVYLTKREDISQALKDYLDSKMKPLLKPTKEVS